MASSCTVVIYDMKGRMWIPDSVLVGENEVVINLNSLYPGMCIVNILYDSKVYRKLICKSE